MLLICCSAWLLSCTRHLTQPDSFARLVCPIYSFASTATLSHTLLCAHDGPILQLMNPQAPYAAPDNSGYMDVGPSN